MHFKKLRRKCGVRGCKNLDTFAISRTREVGNTVIICRNCLKDALDALENPVPATDIRAKPQDAPPLFFNGVPATVKTEDVPTEQSETAEYVEDTGPTQDAEVPPDDTTEFVCPYCGQVCKSELGLQKHIQAKHKDLA